VISPILRRFSAGGGAVCSGSYSSWATCVLGNASGAGIAVCVLRFLPRSFTGASQRAEVRALLAAKWGDRSDPDQTHLWSSQRALFARVSDAAKGKAERVLERALRDAGIQWPIEVDFSTKPATGC
jgi:hypothetical protein